MNFELISEYQPTGDQPEAIAQLTEGVLEGVPAQTLLGVTGSGKTFTIANVIKNINKPTLILSHNKTLAAQLYGEFKSFFPNNAVEYYVSYYDYYQPEAYLPSSDTYIEKDLAINEEIDKLRLAATSALLSGRKDVVVVSSVSCIYGMGNPSDFYNNVIEIKKGKLLDRNVFLRRLVDSLYVRNDIELNRGNFRVKGDTVDIYLAYSDNLLRVMFWDDEIDAIEEIDPVSGIRLATFDEYKIYPANLFMTTKESQLRAIHQIEDDLTKEVAKFEEEGKMYEAKRLYERVTYDMEMIRELGHCSGIENYSRYFDGRNAGTRPYCLLDFFPDDFLIQSATAAYIFQRSVQMCDRCLDLFLRCLFCSAQHNRTRMCRLRSQQILRHVRKFRLQLCVDYGNDISDLIPPIQRFIPQHIKEFIHIVYTGWFHQYPIIPAHSHCDQLRAKSPPVCFPVASTGDHLQLALIPHQFLQ